MTEQSKEDVGFAAATFKGAFFLSSLRWVVRFIGLISVSITARILTPDDFGVHSTASIIVGLFIILQHGGVPEFLIKRDTVDASVINTAWTVRIVFTSAICCMILAVSPFAPTLLNEPRVFGVIIIYAFIPLLDALAHPQIMLLMREMRYGEVFKIRLIERLIGFVVGISMVLLFRNYWGIIVGAFCTSAIFSAYTHIRWAGRPRFDITHIREVSRFASLAMVRLIATYVGRVADSVAARQITTSATFGGYHNSKELSSILIAEVSDPLGAALLPALSKMRSNKSRIAKASKDAFGAILILTVGLSTGLYLVAPEVILIVLGDQWVFATPYMRLAALFMGASILTLILGNFFVALDKQKLLTAIIVVRAIFAASLCWYFLKYQSLEYLLYVMIILSAVFTLTAMAFLAKELRVGFTFFSIVIRPALAGIAMMLLAPLIFESIKLAELPLLISAVAKVLVGGGLYTFIILTAWFIAGRPEGPEQALLDRTGLPWRRYLTS